MKITDTNEGYNFHSHLKIVQYISCAGKENQSSLQLYHLMRLSPVVGPSIFYGTSPDRQILSDHYQCNGHYIFCNNLRNSRPQQQILWRSITLTPSSLTKHSLLRTEPSSIRLCIQLNQYLCLCAFNCECLMYLQYIGYTYIFNAW